MTIFLPTDLLGVNGFARKGKRTLICVCALLLLSGCATRNHSHIEPTASEPALRPQGEKFDNYLSEGYLRMAKQAEFERDFSTVEQFRQRGLWAMQGRLVNPEEIGARQLPAFAVGELIDARRWLVQALQAGAPEAFPWEAARAQLMFDCWMEEQEENIQQADIDECKSGFYAAMQVIYAREPELCAAPAPLPAPVAVTACPVQPIAVDSGPFVLLFELDKTQLIAESQATFEAIVAAAKQRQPNKILLRGHTDLSGNTRYNRSLSLRRVEAVIAMLQARGIQNVSIDGEYFGESQPSVKTRDGQREQANRRVEVVFK